MADVDGNLVTKICKRCKNPAPNGIPCVNCGKVTYKSCLKKLQKKYKHIKFIDNNRVICCQDDEEKPVEVIQSLVTPAAPMTDSMNATDVDLKICHLTEILNHKDFAIKQMELVIENQLC